MIDNTLENNVVNIVGRISTKLEFSHEIYGEGFYSFILEIPRLSQNYDKVPIMVSERLMMLDTLGIGTFIEVQGQFRSYNTVGGENHRLLLTVFARDIIFLEEILNVKNPNKIYLNGFVCKKPIYRTTPFGREICDLLVAVNRAYYKSDYIPCICWGRNARFSEGLKLGDNIKLWGRVQSRDYQKKLENGEVKSNIAYEMSVSKMEMISENKHEIEEKELFELKDEFQNKDSVESL